MQKGYMTRRKELATMLWGTGKGETCLSLKPLAGVGYNQEHLNADLNQTVCRVGGGWGTSLRR